MSSITVAERGEIWYAWWSDKARAAGIDEFIYTVAGNEIHAHGISDDPDFPTIGWEDKKLVGNPNGCINPKRIKGHHESYARENTLPPTVLIHEL